MFKKKKCELDGFALTDEQKANLKNMFSSERLAEQRLEEEIKKQVRKDREGLCLDILSILLPFI